MATQAGDQAEKPLILVVDDENGPRESLKIILSPNYRVVTAEDGISALTIFKRQNPELVISDVRMPGMSGISLLRKIKAIDPEATVILITGYASIQTAQEALRADAFDYINKPYDVKEIQAVVTKALTRVRERHNQHRLLHQLQAWNRDLQEQIGQLDQKATVADLSAELIHDLNNPMTVLQGYISLLEDSLDSNGPEGSSNQMEEFMGIVKTQVERCVALTRNFLDFARQASGKWEKSNVNELIQDTMFVLRVRMMKQSVECSFQPDPDIPDSWFMPTAMQQSLYNLVANAIDAVCDRPDKGAIMIATRIIEHETKKQSAAEFIQIIIEDNGAGIPEDKLKQIFTPFFTTKEKGKGTGLGLSICQRVAEEHQGELLVHSQPGKGTCFTLNFPLLLEAPER